MENPFGHDQGQEGVTPQLPNHVRTIVVVMNSAELRQKFIAAAGLNPQCDQASCVVATRIKVLTAADSAADRRLFSRRGFRCLASSCVAATIVRGATSRFAPASSDIGNDLPPHFENTLLASLVRGGVTP